MAKSKKKKLKATSAPKEQTTIPLTGHGVEEIRIKALDNALDKLITHSEAAEAAIEARDDAKKAVVEIMRERRSELLNEENGGVSYSYDARLFKLAPTSEKLTMKVIHDKNLGGDNTAD